MKNPLLITSLFILVAPFSSADTQRQHDVHEHGAARLGIAQEGAQLQIELHSPAFNLIGFEHAPSNENEKQVLASALKRLANSAQLFNLPAAAKCQATDVELHTPLAEAHEDDHHEAHDEHEHDEHEHEAHKDHDHDEHQDDKHEEHEHDHEQDTNHSDVEVHWSFHCAAPEKLATIQVILFNEFSNLTDLDVDYLTDLGQGAIELTPNQATVTF